MSNHYIKNIDIIKFKCFENFSSSGFSRVNLISGKNNVGKTAFMEAVYVNVSAETIETFATSLANIKFMRENINILYNTALNNNIKLMEAIKIYKTQSNNKSASFEILQKNGEKKYLFNINSEENTIESNKFSFEYTLIRNIEFIDNFGWSNDEIISAYSFVQINDKEDYLNNIINTFDNKIESFKVIDSKPQCKVNGEYVEITEFGDGLRHLISIVCAVFMCKDGHLFIDEIDNGIHYIQLDEIWKIIFEVSKELNCQVFATTHSKEMIESFTRSVIKQEDKEVSFIEFGKDKQNNVKANVMNFEQLNRNINIGNKVRGW
jgi:AAA15 family ATPase/GTPase